MSDLPPLSPQVELRVDLYPLVITTLRGRPSDEDFEAYFAHFEALLATKKPFVSLTDTLEIEAVPTAAQRQRIAKAQDSWGERFGTDMGIAVAMVIGNALVRGAMTALHWLSPPPVPTKAFATEAEALVFLIDHLEQRGMSVTPDIRQYLARAS